MDWQFEQRLATVEATCAEFVEWRRRDKPVDRLNLFESQLRRLEAQMRETRYDLYKQASYKTDIFPDVTLTPRQERPSSIRDLGQERLLGVRDMAVELAPNHGKIGKRHEASSFGSATYSSHFGSDEASSSEDDPDDLERDQTVDHVEDAMTELTQVPKSKDLEASVFGVVIACTSLVFGAKVPDKRLVAALLTAWCVAFLSLSAQAYLIYQVTVYISNPTVTRIQNLYKSYEQQVYVNGTFSEPAWLGLDDDLIDKVCEVPISHITFAGLVLMMWMTTCLYELKLDFGRAASILFTRTSERCVVLGGILSYDGRAVLLEAASVLFKLSMSLFIFLPKIVLQFVLAITGCRWLLATVGFTEVLLNAVALSFITEMDEMLYMILLTDYMKEFHSLVKVRGTSTSRDRELTKGVVVLILMAVSIPAGTFFYLYFGQQVLPGYRFDIYEPCYKHPHRWNGDVTFWQR